MSSQSGAARQSDDKTAKENAPALDRGQGILPTSSIGDVIKNLQADFPEVKVSKIRFFEAEGLISPRRSKSGYRRFSPEDISRIRFILGLQRDEFLPLKVIKERLDAMDAGNVTTINSSQRPVARSSFMAAAWGQFARCSSRVRTCRRGHASGCVGCVW